MRSKQRHEGYVLIDNRDTPGISEALARAAGIPEVARHALYESATITCSHCQQVLFLNPARTRARGYCRKCDHYICDGCTAVMAQTLVCVPFKKIVDEAQENAFLQEQRGSFILTR